MAPRKRSNRVVTKENTATASQKRTSNRPPGKAAQATAERVQKQTGRPVKAVRGSSAVATEPVVHNNPSVPIARELREKLEPLGWTCHATKDAEDRSAVNFSATRDSELIAIRIENGKVMDQRYSIWDAQRPSTNGAPKSRLAFDPEEMSDVELIKELIGQKVQWWNPLAKRNETAIMPYKPENKIKVEHVITWQDGEPDELPGSRVISFVDQTPQHPSFRAFRIGALLKIG
jgi:hypothetical protein